MKKITLIFSLMVGVFLFSGVAFSEFTSTPCAPEPDGLLKFNLVGAASTNATLIKSMPAKVYGWTIWNNHATLQRKLVFHDQSTTPTAGADVYFPVCVPPQDSITVFSLSGISFTNGLGITTVTGLADSDATAIAAQDLVFTIFYK